MVRLKRSEIRVIEAAFVSGGYVFDFTNQTFAEFFEDEFDIDIYGPKYSGEGDSKGKRLRAFVKAEGPALVSRVLRALWAYHEQSCPADSTTQQSAKRDRLFALLSRIEAGLPPRVLVATQSRAWTREELARRSEWEAYLDRCSEDELIEEVLCPLFRQLNFTRITPAGHTDKALEYGKDVWMKYRLPTMHDLYFGIQAKRGKLNASGNSKNTNMAEIHNQAMMMLGHVVFDPEISASRLVDHAIIVSGGEITKQARNWLGERLSASQRSQILFMDRRDLLDLLLAHNTPFPPGLDTRTS